MRDILSCIAASFSQLAAHTSFSRWWSSAQPLSGDLVVCDNSYLDRRETKTTQSQSFPIVAVGSAGALEPLPDISDDIAIKSDYKLLRASSRNLPVRLALPEAIDVQLAGFGRLPFVLIGTVRDDVVVRAPLNHQDFDTLVLDPQSSSSSKVVNRTIISVRHL